jgi:hypothetical protein
VLRQCLTAQLRSSGATGCTINDKTFFNFSWTPTTSGGGTAPTDLVEVVRLDGFGFDFDGAFHAPAGGTADATLKYTVKTNDGAAIIIDASELEVASTTGNGGAIATDNLCTGALFLPGPCPAGDIHQLVATLRMIPK